MLKIDSKEKIDELISHYSSDRERINKILSCYPNINDTQAFILNIYTIAYVLKSIVSKKNYENIVVNIYENDDLESKNENILGDYRGKINGKYVINIYPLNSKYLIDTDIKKIFRALVTFAHEIYHMHQDIDVDSRRFDYFTIVYCFEFLLKDKISGFYKNNYSDLACEIMAEAYGTIVTKKFLQQINNKLDYSNFEEWILKSTRPNYKKFSTKEKRNDYLYELIELALSNNVINNDSLAEYPMLKIIFTEDYKLRSQEHFYSLQNILKNQLETSDISLSKKQDMKEAIESLIEISKMTNSKKNRKSVYLKMS